MTNKRFAKANTSSTPTSVAEIAELKRKLEIEAALEKVRARTMALQHSDELADASFLLVQQVKALGIDTWGCAFNIWDENSNSATEWFSNDEGILTTYTQKRKGIFKKYYEIGKSGESLHIEEFKGQKCKKHYEYMCSLPVVGQALAELQAKGVSFPTYQLDNVAYFKYGYVLFVTFEPVPEYHDIFRRFAKVFEQTYIRFLDLKKAEDQAREAQIEAALERVRARAMAMHRSEELKEVIAIIYQELLGLGLELLDTNIAIQDPATKEITFWGSGLGGVDMPPKFTIPYLKQAVVRKVYDHGFKNGPYFWIELQGRELQRFVQIAITQTEYKNAPKEFQQAMTSVDPLFLSQVAIKHGFLEVASDQKLSQEQADILQRFASVVDLTYTRFDDVVQAEEQARETEIELALERVRARTMAMQHSDELSDASLLLTQQIRALGIETWGCAFHIYDKDSKTATEWFSNAEAALPTYRLKLEKIFLEYYQQGQKGKTLYIKTFEGKACQKHYEYLCTLPGVGDALAEMKAQGIPFPTFQIDHVAYFKYGHLLFITFEPVPEAHGIFERFAKVFEQTYTRFLDLKKAEEQAREAQIEAALERVRASSMAMQRSEEILQVLKLIFRELTNLEFELARCVLWTFDNEDQSVTWWSSNPEDSVDSYRIPYQDHPVCKTYWKEYKKRNTKFRYKLTGKNKESWDQVLFNKTEMAKMPKKVKLAMQSPDTVYLANTFNDFGVLFTGSLEPISEVNFDILIRFAKVFNQSYRRFQDIRQAEDQAREAQIEAALERIRNRTLLMRDSGELNEAVAVFFQEFQKLDLLPDEARTYFCHIDSKAEVAEVWMTRSDGTVMSGSHHTPLTQSKALSKYYQAWKDGTPIIERNYTGKTLNEYLEFVSSLPHVKKDRDYQKIFRCPPKRIVMTDANFLQGNIGIMTFQSLSDTAKDMLVRFAKVFEFTYTRFLDLKKSEQQAREAQIEAAIERIRARAMAMHSSEELMEVADVLREQMNLLGQPQLQTAAIHLYPDEGDMFESWLSLHPKDNSDEIITETITFKKRETKLSREMLSRYQSGDQEYTMRVRGKPFEEWRQMAKQRNPTLIKYWGDEIPGQLYWHFTDFSGGSFVMVSHKPPTEESRVLQRRVSATFDLAYRRFLDLKKAEEQAREAQIEAALERVRSRTMGMQKSEELTQVAIMLGQELRKLGYPKLFEVGYIKWDEKENLQKGWLSDFHGKSMDPFVLPLKGDWVLDERYKAWKTQQQLLYQKIGGKQLIDHVSFCLPSISQAKVKEQVKKHFSDPTHFYHSFFKEGALCVILQQELDNENQVILQRFNRVFEQTYTRFLDLKKAEEQAREAQIEAALERVRASTMAMQDSKKMLEVGALVYRELFKLGITSMTAGITLIDVDDKMDWYYMVESDNGTMMKEPMGIPRDETKIMRSLTTSWEEKEPYHLVALNEKQTIAHQTYIAENSINFSFSAQELIAHSPTRLKLQTFNFKQGYLLLVGGEILSQQKIDIAIRFAKVFEQTYTRFLDLKKAEEQAREAKIETALERVRAAAMAMHASEDLFSVAEILHDQLAQLGEEELESSIIHIYPDNSPTFDAWYSYRATDNSSKQVTDRAIIPNNACSWTKELLALYQSDETSYMIESRGKMLRDWYQVLQQVAPDTLDYDKKGKIIVPKVLYYHFSKFSGGALLMISIEPPTDEAKDMQSRAAMVFDLAYRRFLDLQKAERQAREAQIEAGLERVRASTMAMHSSEDVGTATGVLFSELENLGIETLRCGVAVIKENKTMQIWTASSFSSDAVSNVIGTIDMSIHPLLEQLYQDWKDGKKVFTYELKGHEAEEYYQIIGNQPGYQLPEGKQSPLSQISNGFLFEEGVLFAFTEDPLSHESVDIFQRFTNVFTLTYGRYQDLKLAEARETEAIKQSSLDRVRAEIASMRTTEDLQRITPLIWRELNSLGVPFFRCGVFIIDESIQKVHLYLSTPSGDPLAALDLDFDEQEIPLVEDAVTHWRTQTVHSTHWDQKQFANFTKSLKRRKLIKSLKSYQQGEKPPKSLNLHQVPFKQGMLYVGSSEQLSNAQIELVQALANAFSVAYSRYEDFVQLEEAKANVENTLAELKSAQDQLIHSEKMASLGELTAGIAHEIQNPLNFVNNFAEVSNELLEEMKEEVELDNKEEVEDLIDDLVQNLDKIAHHGKRASGIVRGMLDHSRASSDIKVSTDINVLADEYLRLAYHGFRAKDKSFNANFKANLADDLPKIDIVSQDIGRVILNLVNNAFQAIKEVEDPEVVLETRMEDGKVLISIKDNGPGIPDDIKEKIFQPFFTTKPAGEGTGLGLSLSYDIITKGHGGTIEVFSNKKEGTEFIICIPVEDQALR